MLKPLKKIVFYMSGFTGLMMKNVWLHLKLRKKSSCKFVPSPQLISISKLGFIWNNHHTSIALIDAKKKNAKKGLVLLTNESVYSAQALLGHLNKAISKSRSIEKSSPLPCLTDHTHCVSCCEACGCYSKVVVVALSYLMLLFVTPSPTHLSLLHNPSPRTSVNKAV